MGKQLADTKLLSASTTNDIEKVKELLHSSINVEGYIDSANSFGHTPLINAALLGHYDIVDLLCSNDADINIADIHGETALMAASRNGHIICTVRLVEAGANIKQTSLRGVTAIDIARANGHKHVHDYLFNKVANIGDHFLYSLLTVIESFTEWWTGISVKKEQVKYAPQIEKRDTQLPYTTAPQPLSEHNDDQESSTNDNGRSLRSEPDLPN